MAKIKHTKNELKAQRDALARFQRYLPTLQLKKQQLQLEVRRVEAELEEQERRREEILHGLESWVRLFSEKFDFAAVVSVEDVVSETGNVAGVNVPLLKEVRFRRNVPDLFATSAWVDDGAETVENLVRLEIEMEILKERRRLLREELRVTTQRVNLFEKVKIPESRENIRVIRIFLGDQQTAEVARAKIAKTKSVEKVRSA